MGGNACKNLGVKRKGRKEYESISFDVLQKLKTLPFFSNVFIPKELKSKLSFGDCDVVASFNPNSKVSTNEVKEKIIELFSPSKIIHNGGVFSFPYCEFQIDLITCSHENFDTFYHFYSYNDLSMIIGRLSRIYDLKYGIYGLELPIRDENTNHIIDKLHISKNIPKIYALLGLDYSLFEKGFNHANDIMKFILSSDLICEQFLSSHSENTKKRKRDKNRDIFSYIYKQIQYKNLPKYPKRNIPSNKIAYLDEFFPEENILKRYNELMQKKKQQEIASNKMNGKICIEKFGDELGKRYISAFQKSFSNRDERISYVLSHSTEECIQRAIDHSQ